MSSPDPIAAPYGAFALSPFEESLRRFAMALPSQPLKRSAESLIRRILMSNGREIADVEVFPGQFARVHLRDNRCEKRVFAGSKTWDHDEREAIRHALAAVPADREPVFVDAGANAGLYTLSVLADARGAGRDVDVLAIEPDTENRRRLEFNLAASDAGSVKVLPYALGAEEGEVSMVQPDGNRGEVCVGEAVEGAKVRLVPLATAFAEAGITRPDVMKMDIEGFEEPVLNTFFGESPRNTWPQTILLEIRHGAEISEGASGLCLQNGYQVDRLTRQNAVLVLPDG